VLLEPLLVFTPQINFQHHTFDVGAPVSQARLDGPVSFEDDRVVLKLARVGRYWVRGDRVSAITRSIVALCSSLRSDRTAAFGH
jgi:hypothetical protein